MFDLNKPATILTGTGTGLSRLSVLLDAFEEQICGDDAMDQDEEHEVRVGFAKVGNRPLWVQTLAMQNTTMKRVVLHDGEAAWVARLPLSVLRQLRDFGSHAKHGTSWACSAGAKVGGSVPYYLLEIAAFEKSYTEHWMEPQLRITEPMFAFKIQHTIQPHDMITDMGDIDTKLEWSGNLCPSHVEPLYKMLASFNYPVPKEGDAPEVGKYVVHVAHDSIVVRAHGDASVPALVLPMTPSWGGLGKPKKTVPTMVIHPTLMAHGLQWIDYAGRSMSKDNPSLVRHVGLGALKNGMFYIHKDSIGCGIAPIATLTSGSGGGVVSASPSPSSSTT